MSEAISEYDVFTDRGASSLSRYYELVGIIKTLTEEKNALAEQFKEELKRNPDPIVDGEHGLVATRIERRGAAEFDLISMAQRPEMERLIVEAAREGLLAGRTTAIRAQKGHSEAADVLLRSFEMPGQASYVLNVERI